MPDNAPSKYAPVPGKIPGTSVNLGGHELVVAPLSLPQIEQHKAAIAALGQQSALDESLEPPIICAALQRNYPEITVDEVRELLDITSAQAALAAALGSASLAPNSAQ